VYGGTISGVCCRRSGGNARLRLELRCRKYGYHQSSERELCFELTGSAQCGAASNSGRSSATAESSIHHDRELERKSSAATRNRPCVRPASFLRRRPFHLDGGGCSAKRCS
jgi:hypothetical protein